MKRIFVDTGIFELYFGGNHEIKQLFNEIKNEKTFAFTMELNLFELFYNVCEELGKDVALIRNLSIRKTKIKLLEITEILTEKSASIRCSNSNLSTVDSYICGCAALNNLTIYTTDSDFKDGNFKTKHFPIV
jgi:predicted nucleic acid-binding protein